MCPDVNGRWATLVSVFLAVLRREKERGRARHVWTGAELLVETSGNGLQASSPTLQQPPSPPPSPCLLTHIHKYKLGTSLASLIVSVRLEEACCYTITRQSSPWQAVRQAGRAPCILPSPRKQGPISGVPLHSSRLRATQAVHPSSCSWGK